MACVRKEIVIDARTEEVWAALRDWDAVHERLVRELLVDCDDRARRLVWIADFLPDDVAELAAGMMDRGLGVLKATVER